MRLEPVIGTNIIDVEDGIRLGHTWHEVAVIKQIIETFKPSWFIEVGVHEGGLSYLLIPQYLEMHYMGIEYNCGLVRPIVKKIYGEFGQQLHCGDCFDSALIDKVALLGDKLIYCDGGNKVEELKAYKSACKVGDLIFCHDYHDGKRYVNDMPQDYVNAEVKPEDIEHLNSDMSFFPFSEMVLQHTRIMGWGKV